ncbi:PLP-dependent transferase, partial [Roridomyces roridus]
HELIAACFIGPRAENSNKIKEIFDSVLLQHVETRRNYRPEDGDFITAEMMNSETYTDTMRLTQTLVDTLGGLLSRYSIPFFSPRYLGHMCMETSIPALAGWLMSILYNPNNVAFEVSPITTTIELLVGQQLCEMLGYKAERNVEPWGHLAADGTIANMESMWAARSLKFYPLSLHAAVTRDNRPLAFIASEFKVPVWDSPEPQLFSSLTTWQLLNLAPSVILNIPGQLVSQYSISADFLTETLAPYLAQTTGKDTLLRMYDVSTEPCYLLPSTRHYSWPKAAALLGIGSANCINVPVDCNACMDMHELETALQACLDARRPVYAVVAVIGSTEEGSVDPLQDIIALRDEFALRGLSFIVHADAAWGGYFASMLRPPPPRESHRQDKVNSNSARCVPAIPLHSHTAVKLRALGRADSITIDPHKSGYIPYPAGGLCYRDGRMRHLLTWSAPYLIQGKDGTSIGIYGIEGSKPGAPAVACFLHHMVLGLHAEGHGALLGEVCWTSRRFAAHWATMSSSHTSFLVIPFNAFPDESHQDLIRTFVLNKSNEEIIHAADEKPYDLLCSLGSELNINAFACNFRIDGRINDDVEEANALNRRIFDRFSITRPAQDNKDCALFLSSTVFKHSEYGECVRNFQRRMGLETESRQDLFVLRNVVMSPFSSTNMNLVKELADEFQRVLEEETQEAIRCNTIGVQIHQFIMQGGGAEDELYLVYRPCFHRANGRRQVILRAGIQDARRQREFQEAREECPDGVFMLATAEEMTLEDILSGTSVSGVVSGPGFSLQSPTQISIICVLKNRPLDSRYRDKEYPVSHTPFYVYGAPIGGLHISHILTRAPNAEILSSDVTLDVHPPLPSSDLRDGKLIARIQRSEASMQPLAAQHMPFKPTSRFAVEIFTDSRDADDPGPRLTYGGTRVARGTITLGRRVFVDCDSLN